ncbi:amino acid deaminase [Gilvimarinus polysaccharolyticus]|uniref:amino acid deaminase n=1 Tax=Gilvimarinus polysaccharolyticus TaxID=863921 RepID=UPI0009FE3470|nr:amino acid deaminase [Gilvimarinus polysaccharolyticus]
MRDSCSVGSSVVRPDAVTNKGTGSNGVYGVGVSLLDEVISLPAAVVYQSRLDNNISWMQKYADSRGVVLAPHGKTTMAPAFFQRQRDAGAWGLTVATAQQATAAHAAGISWVLMANQLVGRGNMTLIAELLADASFEYFCLVDSIENIAQLGRFFAEQKLTLNVLIEVGVSGGRCGCRTQKQVDVLCAAIAREPHLALVGVETYEGVISGADAPVKIRQHLLKVRNIAELLMRRGEFAVDKALLTGAGSAWYDIVCDVFSEVDTQHFIPVIRPGCYLIHDRGIYMDAQQKVRQRLGDSCAVSGDLQSALEVWAYVQSIPEPGNAILTVGKRDAAFDAGLPQPSLHYRPGWLAPVAASSGWELYHIMDQHSAMRFDPEADLKVGDIIALSTSHPCLTFDKWRKLNVIDDSYTVIEQVDTCF